MEEAKNVLKNLFIRFIKPFLMTLLVVVLIFSLVTTLLAAAAYFIFVWVDGIGEDDWSNPSYASNEYTSNISITENEDRKISSNMTAQEIWDKMIANGSRVDLYLDGPEELEKLMNAELVTQFPDMRENPNEEIDWGEVEEGNIQGIIKFRRADNDGTVKTLSYMPPSQFDLYMREYNTTGSAEARDQILSHFTLKKGNAGIAGSINYNGPDLCWPVEPHFVTITSQFGYRGSVGVAGATANHGAIDIGDGGIEGTPAYACEKGTVTGIANDGGYHEGRGNYVQIDHGNGYVSMYYHLQTGSVVVQPGDEVKKGQVIAAVGNTGASTGPHMHFEIQFNGVQIDPLGFKYNNGMGEGTGGFGVSDDEDEEDKEEEGEENNDTTEDEDTEDTAENEPEESGIDTSKLYFIGDSWIEGLSGKGIADTTYFTGKQSKSADYFLENPGEIQNYSDASAIVLSLGLNRPDDPTSMQKLIDQLRNQYPDKKIYVVEVAHVASYYQGSISATEMNNLIDSYNENIKNYCNSKENIEFLEVASKIEGSDGWLKYSDSSGYHLTDEGYQIWYDSIIAAIGGDSGGSTSTSTRKTHGYYAVIGTWTQVDGSFTWTDDNWEQATDDMNIDVATDGEAQEGTNEEVTVTNNTMTSTKSTMTYTNINYEEYVQNLTMPFDLLWSLLVIGEDKSFVFDMADLAYNSTIEITIFDNITINTNIDNWTYGYQEKVEVEGTVTATGGNTTSEVKVEKHEHEGEPDPIMGGGEQTENTDGENTEENNNAEETDGTQTGSLSLEPSAVEVVSNKKIAATTIEDLLDQEPPTQEEVDDIINGDNNDNTENEQEEGENNNKEESEVEHTDDTVDDVAYYYIQNEVVTTTNTVTIALTRADVWMMDYRQEYTLAVETSNNNNGTLKPEDQEYKFLEKKQGPNEDYTCEEIESAKEEVKKKWSEDRRENGIGQGADMSAIARVTQDIDLTYYYRYVGQTDNVTNNIKVRKYIKGTPIITEKVDEHTAPNFVTLFNESDRMGTRSNIRSAASWLFEIMEHKESTSGTILDLIKYLLYKATDTDYGVTDFDFSIFLEANFSGVSGIVGNGIEEKVWFALLNLGYTKEQAAGVMGNIWYESGGFDPAAIEGGTGVGIGLCQWSYDRRTALESFAAFKGVSWTDENIQVEFLIGELTPGGGANGFATYQFMSYNGYTPSDFYNATTVEDATRAFCWTFERPRTDAGNSSMSTRITEAQRYYNTFKDKEIPSETSTSPDSRIGEISLSGDNKNKMIQMLNEALRIADDDRYQYSQALRYEEFYYDCSSFVSRLYQQFFGINPGNTTYDYGNSNYTTNLSENNLEPGDVLWSSGHVAIYLGNGQYVHAASPSSGICVTSLSAYNPFTRVYRFIN